MPKRTAALAEFQIWCSGAKSMDWEVSPRWPTSWSWCCTDTPCRTPWWPIQKPARPLWTHSDCSGNGSLISLVTEWRSSLRMKPGERRLDVQILEVRQDGFGADSHALPGCFCFALMFLLFSQSSLSFASSAFASCFPASKFVARQYCLSSTSCQPES